MTLIEHAQPKLTLDELDAAADLLRRMIYLPNASVLVALDGREMAAMGMLSLRPSVAAAGPVAAIDLFFVEPGREDSAIGALLKELVRSARNKGCTLIEARPPADEAESDLWQALGFEPSAPQLTRFLKQAPVAAR
jgi:GNAT superfamily N-acetyltransferase